MKKIITLLFFVLIVQLNAQNTFVPDDNFEQALIDLGYDSGPLDDYVPTTNINTLTSLDVSSKNIADLTGIEDFTALATLSCHNNQLTALNISNLTNLGTLYCQNNQITSIDISNNLALYYFNCYNNSLPSLSITNNTSLIGLYCGVNQLNTLDVSNNTALQTIFVQQNQLTSLDVSNNVNLQRFYCNDNQLTYLNLQNGNNTIITDTNFIVTNNPDLTCILVDDASWSTTNWTAIDATSTFVNSQAECDALGIEDNNFEEAINLYPNPAKESFTIINNGNIEINKITIYDLLGKVVYQANTVGNSINTSNFKEGLFLVKLNSNNNSITKKIIISK